MKALLCYASVTRDARNKILIVGRARDRERFRSRMLLEINLSAINPLLRGNSAIVEQLELVRR